MADDAQQTQTSDDLAQAALSQNAGSDDANTSETQASDKLAETLSHLQNILERYAMELETIGTEMKAKRESLKSIFENDQELSKAEEEAKTYSTQAKERKGKLQSSPEAVGLKNQLTELSEQKKEIEETISNHLLNYYAITNSKSFDTSDGDQWEFDIKARVKSRKK